MDKKDLTKHSSNSENQTQNSTEDYTEKKELIFEFLDEELDRVFG